MQPGATEDVALHAHLKARAAVAPVHRPSSSVLRTRGFLLTALKRGVECPVLSTEGTDIPCVLKETLWCQGSQEPQAFHFYCSGLSNISRLWSESVLPTSSGFLPQAKQGLAFGFCFNRFSDRARHSKAFHEFERAEKPLGAPRGYSGLLPDASPSYHVLCSVHLCSVHSSG